MTQQAIWECKKAVECVTIQKLYRDLGVLECRLARGGWLQYKEVYCNRRAGWPRERPCHNTNFVS